MSKPLMQPVPLVVFLIFAAGSSAARAAGSSAAPAADPVAAELCAQAAEEAQVLRRDGHIWQARGKLVDCSGAVCPVVVARECTRWLNEVDASAPSLVVRVVDDKQRDVSAATVFIDERMVAERLTGAAFPVDPGAHVIRVDASGRPSAEESVVIALGDRERAVVVHLAPSVVLSPVVQATPSSQAATDALSIQPGRSGARATASTMDRRLIPLVVGGVALAAFASFEAAGQLRYQDLKDGCGQTGTCSDDAVTGLRNRFVGAGIALGAAVVAAGILIWQTATATH